MISCDATGPVGLMVTDISFDPHAGEVATGRLFSGSLKRGDSLYVMGSAKKENRLQQVGIFMGPKRVEVEEIVAGNIAAVTGLRDAMVGSTVTTLMEMAPFESLKHYSRTGHDRRGRGKEHEGPAQARRSAPAGGKGRPDARHRHQRRDGRAPDLRYGRAAP